MGGCASRSNTSVLVERHKTDGLLHDSQEIHAIDSKLDTPSHPITTFDNVSTDDVWDDDGVADISMGGEDPTPPVAELPASPVNSDVITSLKEGDSPGGSSKPALKVPTTDQIKAQKEAARRRRLSVSTVDSKAVASPPGDPKDANGVPDSLEPSGDKTVGVLAPERATPDVGENSGKRKPQRRETIKFRDPAMELVEEVHGGCIKEVTLKMLNGLFPNSEHYAVFGSPCTSTQRSYDNKAHVEDGVMPIGKSLRHIGVGYACKKGLKPESPNQDDFFVLRVDDWAIYGVFDGHGPFGHDISAFVHRTLPFLIIGDPDFETDLKASLRRAFLRVHELVGAVSDQKKGHHPGFNCALSGTTGTVIVHRDNKLTIAHVGDSRAVMAKKGPDEQHFTSFDLTHDHKPTNGLEQARIESSGGEVRRLDGDVPFRVFVKNQMYPGLAMSRAIGDLLAVAVGVTPEPEVSEIELSSDDQFFVIATDGVWEFINSQEAIDLLGKKSAHKVNESSELLAYEAWRRWVTEEENVVDDVTCIVVWLDFQGRENIGSSTKRSDQRHRRSSMPGHQKFSFNGGRLNTRREQRCNSVTGGITVEENEGEKS